MAEGDNRAFEGAKLALFIGDRLLVIRRDLRTDIPWPGYLDLPGGAREGQETARACVLRETREETGLILRAEQLIWARHYPDDPTPAWFFAARLPASAEAEIVFGGEGQGWLLMAPDAYVASPEAIPHFRLRVREFLDRPEA